jgi:hypothetical protein
VLPFGVNDDFFYISPKSVLEFSLEGPLLIIDSFRLIAIFPAAYAYFVRAYMLD